AWGLALDPAAGLAAGALLAAAGLADALLLVALPRLNISHGPWRAQLYFLLAPRAAVALLLLGPAVWLGPAWGLALLAGLQVGAWLALAYASLVEPQQLGLSRLEVESERLPAGTAPIRILHISDLHISRPTRREAKVLALARQARPDLIVLTGDYVNLSNTRDGHSHAAVRRLLSQLAAPGGVYAVLGSPSVDLRPVMPAVLADLPLALLCDQARELDLGPGRRLWLLGLTCSHYLPHDRPALARLAAAAPADAFKVLLYHSPELMPEAAGLGLDLYLCGHTHGGQVRLPLIGPLLTGSQLGRRYVMGAYREGYCQLYVSRGLGMEGLSAPRVRFGCRPELTLVVLRPAAA
ncbi:MAG: metallophosphoesterase, partial [Candidatus Promineifilaceae bacterium]